MSFFKQGCQKTGPIIYKSGKTGSVIYFFLEKGAYRPTFRIPGTAEKGGGGLLIHACMGPEGSPCIPLRTLWEWYNIVH